MDSITRRISPSKRARWHRVGSCSGATAPEATRHLHRQAVSHVPKADRHSGAEQFSHDESDAEQYEGE